MTSKFAYVFGISTMAIGLLTTGCSPSLNRKDLGNIGAKEQPSYYRIWQGFKKPELTADDFKAKIPEFMNWTTRLYRDETSILNNYLVAMTPYEIAQTNAPAIPVAMRDMIPDEFALVAVKSEADYLRVRATEDGIKYGEAHWDVFDKTRSASAKYVSGLENLPEVFTNNQAMDVLARPVDWEKGVTTFWLGTRKATVSKDDFLKAMSAHIKNAAGLQSLGLKGYIAIVNEDYEAAYMNWESQKALEAAFASEAGKLVYAEGASLMDAVLWAPTSPFNKTSVDLGGFYSTAAGN